MPVYPSVRDHGVSLCERAGYDVTVREDLRGPPALAEPEDAAVGLVDAEIPRPVAIEPLTEADVGPSGLVPRFADALREGRDCLFVVPSTAATGTTLTQVVATVLGDPACVAVDEPDGRHFYKGPDRVPLSDGSYACARAPAADLQWREVRVDEGRPRLELSVGTEVVAVFEHVDALGDAGRHAFQYAYRRADDGRFEVTAGGEVVERFPGPTAMRRGGYAPVPMPIVPEHLFPADADRSRWAVCQPDGGEDVLTAAGLHAWV
ncbi:MULTISPECIES: hypothetical protein [Haloarcula]|uniref:Uncharacterized protein n=1 Tax=Haloarcula pellucida TaxID=1427151 RepID=A0A830GHI5_9EURY|nr:MULTISPECIES: hypothetical protein [Halomicroarcula]MBX0346616.1 hypothetical protein [Halomicroarcula pellucida]MDS0277528.1 hypothetical protein [Halomicroarcula sp. S1AR25-4]GGN84577.1 hypothetical protein GCM10009030_00340 [Halomicroarcula pellucida]